MAVYLYNLIFSLTSTDTPFGRFQQYPTALPPNPSVLNMSSAWFTYKNQGTPNDLGEPYSRDHGVDPDGMGYAPTRHREHFVEPWRLLDDACVFA